MPLARISLTLSRHVSLSFIASRRSSGLHPVSSHSCCMYVRAGRPPFAWPYVGVHWSTSLMSSSLLLQQCPACLVCLTWIVFVMAVKRPYSWCFVGCYRQVLFNIARNIKYLFKSNWNPVGWGCRIHRLDHYGWVKPLPTRVLDILNPLMMRHPSVIARECRIPLFAITPRFTPTRSDSTW